MAASKFPGFPRETATYLRALAKHNDRDWFQAHKRDYESCYLEPAQAFVSAMAPELRKLSKGIVAEPRVNGAIMRIQRPAPMFGPDAVGFAIDRFREMRPQWLLRVLA